MGSTATLLCNYYPLVIKGMTIGGGSPPLPPSSSPPIFLLLLSTPIGILPLEAALCSVLCDEEGARYEDELPDCCCLKLLLLAPLERLLLLLLL